MPGNEGNAFSEKLRKRAKRILREAKGVADLAASTVAEGTDSAVKIGAKHIRRLQDRRVSIGITGLSRSGKTTLLTSLLSQLINFDKAALTGFEPALGDRILNVLVHPLEDSSIPLFDYQKGYESLVSNPPEWPESTTGSSGCVVELVMTNVRGRFNPYAGDTYSLFVEIRDYPGEWLLDLQLLRLSFDEWCVQCTELLEQEPRKSLLGDLFLELQNIAPDAIFSKDVAKSLVANYTDFLQRCKKHKSGLSIIQPGRFICPSDDYQPDRYLFVPLLTPLSGPQEKLQKTTENSYYAEFRASYDRYVDEIVRPFYNDYFRRLDRQLVLVDVVSALNSGPAHTADVSKALSSIAESFSYGNQNILSKLVAPKIDKVVFVATKCDLLFAEDHDGVRQLLSLLVRDAYRQAQHSGLRPKSMAVAAVRSSIEETVNGKWVISTYDKDGRRFGHRHPRIKGHFLTAEEFKEFGEWEMPELVPPAGLSRDNHDAIPHIRLDLLIEELFGDKC